MLSRFSLLLVALGIAQASADEPQAFWRVSGGAAYRQLGDLHWNTGVDSPAYLFQMVGPDSFGGPAGSISALGNRMYRDGYVNIETNTTINGSTWFWGYTDNAQVQGSSLFFHSGPGAYNSTQSTLTSGDWTDQNPDGFGPVLQVEWVHRLTPSLSWSLLGGLFFTQFNSGHSFSNFAAMNTTGSVVDRYDLGGLVPPSAPFFGDFTGPGPAISNVPAQRTLGTDAKTTAYANSVRQSFDLNLFTLSLGPTIEWHHQNLGLQASAGFALNVAHWHADQRESLISDRAMIAEWVHRESKTEALGGAFMQGSILYALNSEWHAAVFIRYDWSQGIEARVGPSSLSVDLDALSAGVMIGRTF